MTKPAAEIEREIESVRMRLDRSLAELDRRRHQLMDVKLQVRKHPQAVMIAGGVVVLLVGVGWLAARSAHKAAEDPRRRAKRLKKATRRAMEHPERVAQNPPLWQKIAASVGTTIAVAVTKRLLDRALQDAGRT
jgi:prefoldin subunit 5